jgi:hypothetical protein
VLDELGGVESLWAVPIALAVSVDVGLVFVITVVAARRSAEGERLARDGLVLVATSARRWGRYY